MNDLVQNGWFVDEDGDVYVVINGSAYAVDASDTPIAKLPPGSYTNEEAEAALEGQKQQDLRDWLHKRGHWEDQPRVPAGSPEGGQFGSGSEGGAAPDVGSGRGRIEGVFGRGPGGVTREGPLVDRPNSAQLLRESASQLTGQAIKQDTPQAKPNSKLKEVVAKELNERAGDKLEEAFGVRSIDAPNPTTDDYLSNVIVDDLKGSLESGHGSPTWYSDKMKEAMTTAAEMHPELAVGSDGRPKDPDAFFAYTASLAVTSQGEKVDQSARLTEQAYATFRDTGKFPEDIRANDPNIAGNFEKMNALIDKMDGVENVREFFDRKMTVKELYEATGYQVPGTSVTDVVNGSAILGPKIGMGFYQNLNGNFEPLTMDLWFMRSWGRITNTGFDQAEMTKPTQRLQNALRHAGRDAPTDGEKLLTAAQGIARQHERDFRNYREEFNTGARKKSELVYAAERYVYNYGGAMVEQPKGAGQRQWITNVFEQAQGKLANEGVHLTPAAMQATWWNPEKNLYRYLGARVPERDTDYAQALRRIADARRWSRIPMMTKQDDDDDDRDRGQGLQFAPWIDDPDPPDYMTRAEIEAMAERAARWWRQNKNRRPEEGASR